MFRKTILKFVSLSMVLAITAALSAGCANTAPSQMYTRPESVASSADAQKLLIEGNKRYVSNTPAGKNIGDAERKNLSANGQKPFAVIVSCSDSRVPPEVIFDQDLGDLFVVRDAGNVVDPVTLGSIEYGAEHLKAPLIIVLGHEKCGAVKATVDSNGEAEGNIGAIVKEIKPSFEKAKASGASKDELYEKSTDENIKNTIAEIKNSPIIKELEEEKKVTVIGAKYHIDTGEVTFEQEAQ